MTEPDPVDPDDIAYVGDEDDERGPGCLVAMAVVSSAFAVVGCLGTLVWVVGTLGNNVGPNGFFTGLYIFFAMAASVAAGGFGLGLGLFAASRARLSPLPWLSRVATVAWVSGLAAAGGVVLQVVLLIAGNWNR